MSGVWRDKLLLFCKEREREGCDSLLLCVLWFHLYLCRKAEESDKTLDCWSLDLNFLPLSVLWLRGGERQTYIFSVVTYIQDRLQPTPGTEAGERSLGYVDTMQSKSQCSCCSPCSCLGLFLGWKKKVTAKGMMLWKMLWVSSCAWLPTSGSWIGGTVPNFLEEEICHRQLRRPASPVVLCRRLPSVAAIAQAVCTQALLYSAHLEETEIE